MNSPIWDYNNRDGIASMSGDMEVQTIDDIAILNLSGEVSHQEMQQLEDTLMRLSALRRTKVVLNFRQVSHLHYASIERLLKKVKYLRTMSGDIKLASLNDYTKNIFQFAGAYPLVEAYDSVYDAIMSFQGEQEQHRTWH
ncbi:MAG: STAS domain-containing protein [Deltaproteobacteria bacterium]|nr:STAS domain-containing protein [Deltaproteobacteria bacterium]